MHATCAAPSLISDMAYNIPSTESIFLHLFVILYGIWHPLGPVEAAPIILVVIDQHGYTAGVGGDSLERID